MHGAACHDCTALTTRLVRSFKQPLLFSAAVCLAGNVLYCLSYERRSLALLLAARMANGLGSARSCNRRYTADYVSKMQRTMASAGERCMGHDSCAAEEVCTEGIAP